jgi:hypothetical protein
LNRVVLPRTFDYLQQLPHLLMFGMKHSPAKEPVLLVLA